MAGSAKPGAIIDAQASGGKQQTPQDLPPFGDPSRRPRLRLGDRLQDQRCGGFESRPAPAARRGDFARTVGPSLRTLAARHVGPLGPKAGSMRKLVGGGHLAERDRIVRHDQRRLVADEHDHVPAFAEDRAGKDLQAGEIGLFAPGARRAGIDLTVDEAVRRENRQHELGVVGPPRLRQLGVGHPQAKEFLALLRRLVVDLAPLPRRAFAAPDARRLLELRQRIDLAAKRAGPAGAPERCPIRCDDHR